MSAFIQFPIIPDHIGRIKQVLEECRMDVQSIIQRREETSKNLIFHDGFHVQTFFRAVADEPDPDEPDDQLTHFAFEPLFRVAS